MKTLMMGLSYGQSIRDILRTDCFKVLKQQKDLKIVLVTPFSHEPAFYNEMAKKNVFLEQMIEHKPSFFENTFRKLKVASFTYRYKISTMTIRAQKTFWRSLLTFPFRFRLFNGKLAEKLFTITELHCFREKNYISLLDKYQPDLVLTTPVFLANDLYLLKEAKLHNIPTAIQVGSWDNLTNKGELPVAPNYAFVWNEVLKKQLVKYHRMKPNEIIITGPPHFDLYRDESKFLSRTAFCKQFNLNPKKKIILYATATIYPDDKYPISILKKAIDEGKIDAQLLVRPHPRDPENFTTLSKGVALDKSTLKKNWDKKNKPLYWNPSEREMYHLAESLHHSALCINPASTMTLDAFASHRPAIFIAFDGKRKPEMDSIRTHYKFEHHQPLLQSGGVSLAHSPQELIEKTNRYLNNPTLDEAGRKKAISTLLYSIDGNNAKRLAKGILKLLKIQ